MDAVGVPQALEAPPLHPSTAVPIVQIIMQTAAPDARDSMDYDAACAVALATKSNAARLAEQAVNFLSVGPTATHPR